VGWPRVIYHSFFYVRAGEAAAQVLPRRGRVRGITDISYRIIKTVQQHLDWGHDIRHTDKYSGLIFVVFERKYGLSAINIDLEHLTNGSRLM
jgi:hypothetical protein